MQLRCPHCRSLVPSADINLNLVVAKCSACDHVFSFGDELGLPLLEKPQVEAPKRFQIENWGPELKITFRWYTHAVWVLIGFCVVWDGIIVAFYSAIIPDLLDSKFQMMELFGLLFPVLHVLVGLALTYACVASLLNKTTIKVSRHDLEISHGPVPCGKTIVVPAGDIQQLYCVKKEHRHKRSTSYSYELNALMRDGVSQTLLKNLQEYRQARYLEQELETHLEIEDQRMGEEVACELR